MKVTYNDGKMNFLRKQEIKNLKKKIKEVKNETKEKIKKTKELKRKKPGISIWRKKRKKWIIYPTHLYRWFVKWKITDNIIFDIILTMYDIITANFIDIQPLLFFDFFFVFIDSILFKKYNIFIYFIFRGLGIWPNPHIK